jgi:predicted metal-dependent peptidase
MKTVHCVDVSGSMSGWHIDRAQAEVMRRFKPKDIVVLFDRRFQVVTDLERKFTEYLYPNVLIGRGGSDPTEAIEFAKKQNAKSIIYTDGYILDTDLSKGDEIVIIT